MKIPALSLSIDALTDELDDPKSAVQYSVVDPDGTRKTYGDQDWIAYGGVLRWAHTDGRIQHRTITITYGEWEDAAVTHPYPITPDTGEATR